MKGDTEIQKKVMEGLEKELPLIAAEIGVAVHNGVVTLSGEVERFSEKRKAEKLAAKVKGVKAVAEEIEVKTTGSNWRNDAEIAESIINALKWHSVVKDDSLKIKVESGWVTIEGLVDWEFEKNTVVSLVEDLIGVRGITNLIKIDSKIKLSDVKRHISASFHKTAKTDNHNIKVELKGNKVTLKGTVTSLEERKDAEKAALSTPGVTEVDNQLIVENKLKIDTKKGTSSLL